MKIDVKAARREEGKFPATFPASIKAEITNVYTSDWKYPYRVHPLASPDWYTQHIYERWIIRGERDDCRTCDSEKMYHDKKEIWFCPFCHD